MLKQFQHIIVSGMLLFAGSQAVAQVAVPDTVCVGVNRVYKVNDPTVPSTYTWKLNGITQASTANQVTINWTVPGTFLLTVQEHGAGGCDGDIQSGLIYVIPPPVANAGPDVMVCFGNTVRLAGSSSTTYQWSPATFLSNANIANPVATLPAAGVYRYVLTAGGNICKAQVKDTVVITMLPPAKIFAGNDTAITFNQPLQLNAIDINNSGFINYTWSPSFGLNNALIKNPVAKLTNNTIYTVSAQTADGCTAKDDIVVKVFAVPEIFIPNAFTPNGDGVNDILRPILTGIKQLKYFTVYNRYGQQVYITSVPGEGWNGMINGVMQNTGAFAWMAEAVDYNGNTIKRNGMAILLK